MARSMNAPDDLAARTMSTERLFDAPRDLVFRMWTDPNHIAQWWGPRGFTNTIESMDVRPGGVWKFVMHGPNGVDYPNMITYLEIKEPERLVYDHGEEGQPTCFRVTVTFEAVGNKTRVSMQGVFSTAEDLRFVVEKYNAIEGLKQNMDKLAEYLATKASRRS